MTVWRQGSVQHGPAELGVRVMRVGPTRILLRDALAGDIKSGGIGVAKLLCLPVEGSPAKNHPQRGGSYDMTLLLRC